MKKISALALSVSALTLIGIGAASADSAQATNRAVRTPNPWGDGRFGAHHHFGEALLGSWQVTYDVPAFVIPIPILLTFTGSHGALGALGEVIETDSPAPTPVGALGTLILSNGHGAWGYHVSDGKYSYLYHKLIYDQNGNSFGVAHTAATVTPSQDGQRFDASLLIKFIDNQGNVVLSATGSATAERIGLEESIDP